MKKCQFCGNEILDVAKKCKHCGKWLINKEAKIEQVEKTVKEPEQTTSQIQSKKCTKNCPYCCKEISAEAKKCPYCSEWVVKKYKNDSGGCGCLALIIIVVLFVILMPSDSSNTTSDNTKIEQITTKEATTSNRIDYKIIGVKFTTADYLMYFGIPVQKPEEKIAIVSLNITNRSKQPYSTSSTWVQLTDSNGYVYDSDNSYLSLMSAPNLNPLKSVERIFIFKVEEKDNYILEVHDSLFLGDTVKLKL